MDADTLKREIEEFLAAHHVVHLATTAVAVHAVSVMYAPEGMALVWMSSLDTRHSRHLESDARVAATVAPDYTDFRDIRGLQIFGRAQRITSVAAVARAMLLMTGRYGFLRELASGPAPLRQAFERASFYRLDPERITLIDNTRGFGHKDTLLVTTDGGVSVLAEQEAD